MSNIQQLARFIEQHGVEVVGVDETEQLLFCNTVFMDCNKGTSFVAAEPVSATLQDVRDYLGY